MSKKRLFSILAVFALVLVGTSQSASAWWGVRYPAFWGGPYWGYSGWGYSGWYGGWDCCGCDPCGYTSCGCETVVADCCAPAVAATPVVSTVGYAPVVGVRRGPVRRLLFGRYRWYGGFWGYGACCPGYYISPCCGEEVLGTPVESAPLEAAPSVPATSPAPVTAPAENEHSVVSPDNSMTSTSSPIYHSASYPNLDAERSVETPTSANSGMLTIYVPYDAVVYVNDLKTSTDGSRRSFVSYGLESGNEYDYVVRAEVIRDGRKHVETQLVTLQAGASENVSFAFQSLVQAPAEYAAY